MRARARPVWTFALTSIALFMFSLDRLIVTTALPVIRERLGASIEALEWTVNAYTLTFAVLVLTGAALGDRFGRRRLFLAGVAIFTGGSAAALASSIGALVAARAFQGLGGAILTPLSLTIVNAAVPARRRGVVLGTWGAVAGLAVVLGPVVGGALSEALSWQSIFWLNVPLGLVVIALAPRRIAESYGPAGRLDIPGVMLASASLLALAWGLARSESHGWGSAEIGGALTAGALGVGAFLAWEQRTPAPLLPLRLFANRAFAAANVASLLSYFGVFGSLFLIAQLLRTGLGYSPAGAGIRLLPWTAATMLVIPVAGALCDRLGPRPVMACALTLEAIGLALTAAEVPGSTYPAVVPGLILAGAGSGAFFAPVSHAVLGAVPPDQRGRASGASIAIRELSGVLGVAVLASIFAAHGSETHSRFLAGYAPAQWIGAGVIALALPAALALPRAPRSLSPTDDRRWSAARQHWGQPRGRP